MADLKDKVNFNGVYKLDRRYADKAFRHATVPCTVFDEACSNIYKAKLGRDGETVFMYDIINGDEDVVNTSPVCFVLSDSIKDGPQIRWFDCIIEDVNDWHDVHEMKLKPSFADGWSEYFKGWYDGQEVVWFSDVSEEKWKDFILENVRHRMFCAIDQLVYAYDCVEHARKDLIRVAHFNVNNNFDDQCQMIARRLVGMYINFANALCDSFKNEMQITDTAGFDPVTVRPHDQLYIIARSDVIDAFADVSKGIIIFVSKSKSTKTVADVFYADLTLTNIDNAIAMSQNDDAQRWPMDKLDADRLAKPTVTALLDASYMLTNVSEVRKSVQIAREICESQNSIEACLCIEAAMDERGVRQC